MAHGHAQPGFDPRKIITPESFHVAPHLLGLPLASPSRRLAAVLVDLLLVAILANVGGKILFAISAAVAFFWFAGKRMGNQGGFFSRGVRVAFRGVGALMLFIAALAIWSKAKGDDGGDDEGGAVATASVTGRQGGTARTSDLRSAARTTAVVIRLGKAEDSLTAQRIAYDAVGQLRRMEVPDPEIRALLADVGKDRPAPVRGGVKAAFPLPDSAAAEADAAGAGADSVPADPDSLAAAYVTAVRGGDSARADRLRPKLASTLAADSLGELRGQVSTLEDQNRELEAEKEEAESRGLLATLLKWFDDLGIGFGWTGLYFTFFTARLRGQTPGKKLFGIRVLRLDGQPITLWASFERFGGYAAGLFTGLIGYLQVYWDRNRQAIQDKISETVVIRDAGLPLPTAPVRPGQPPVPPHGPRPFGLPDAAPAPAPQGPQPPYGLPPLGQPYGPPPPGGGTGTP